MVLKLSINTCSRGGSVWRVPVRFLPLNCQAVIPSCTVQSGAQCRLCGQPGFAPGLQESRGCRTVSAWLRAGPLRVGEAGL